MKTAKEKNFERELPAGYRQALYINAKDAKFGIIMNLIALAVLAVVMAVAVLLLLAGGRLNADTFKFTIPELLLAYGILIGTMVVYIVLHELVHGIAYKLMTGEKLTFGISWSCAFCGVPNIYTYRKTALISVAAPFTVFTVVLIPILAVLYFTSPLYFLIMAFIFGLHFGGCSGDLYVMHLFATRFKEGNALMRDTGPEQYFYVYEGEKVKETEA